MLSKFSMKQDSIGYGLRPTDGTHYHSILKAFAIVSFLTMVAAQMVMLITFDGNQLSDAGIYLDLAKGCAQNGWWYPSEAHITDAYLFGNALINMMALVLKVTSNLKVLFFINILFVQMTLWSCLYIVKKIFNRPTLCFFFTILFCLLNTFWSEIVQLRTELPFNALAFAGIAVLFTEKKWSYPLAGAILALANWTRPIALAFLIGAVAMLILNSQKVRHIIAVVGSYGLVILIIGGISYMSCGHFVYQSTTFGYNLIMSANDEADGSYMLLTNEGQVGYIDPEKKKDMIFTDYDEYYTDLSIGWIKENPLDYIKQFPAKLFFLYGTETYSGSAYFNNEQETSGLQYIKSVANKIMGKSDEPISLGDVLIIFNQAWYMLICFMFALGFVLHIKKKQWRSMIPLWLSMLLGTGITILVVGGARYHLPYLPTMIVSAAFACEYLFAGEKTKKTNKKTK